MLIYSKAVLAWLLSQIRREIEITKTAIAVVTRLDGVGLSCHPDDRREEGSPSLKQRSPTGIPPRSARRDDTLNAFDHRYKRT